VPRRLLESLTTRASKAPTAEQMLRYVAAAAALKFASLPPASPLYRKVGNQVGARRQVRSRLDPAEGYVVRARRVLDLCNEHGLIRDGASILEIGTGWVHWEATVLRLFYDVRALVGLEASFTTLEGLRVAPEFLDLSDRDLAYTSIRVLHERAAAGA
jgi:hypothetical protein